MRGTLYQTNWQQGQLGWASSGNGAWKVVNGLLLYDGNDRSLIEAPFRTKHVTNYAVEARIQSLGVTDGNSFGMVIRASDSPDPGYMDGLEAGVYNSNGQSYTAVWRGGVDATNTSDSIIDQSNFDPAKRWHVYRIEVRGNQLKLLIDGQIAVDTATNRFITGVRVGLFSNNVETSVSSFRVVAL